VTSIGDLCSFFSSSIVRRVKMFSLCLLCCLLPILATSTEVLETNQENDGKELMAGDRQEKFLSVFQIVQFNNEACPATSGDTGVCFTEAECSGRGGVASGTCASSFGVCCVFTLSTCGDTVTNNNTYITSPGYPSMAPAGMCMFNLNKCDNNICQMRLEFEDVVTADPAMGDCNNDTIIVSQVDAASALVVPSPLCGTLSGQHMIIDVKDQTPGAKITFNIVSANAATKWRAKVVQISCDDRDLLAPPGCLTYHTEPSGTLESYNYNGGNGELINNQKYSHCIKHQDGFCDVTLSAQNFDLGTGDSLTFGGNSQTGPSQVFGTAGSLLWNFTGPYVVPFHSDDDNTAMNGGYSISYLLLPC